MVIDKALQCLDWILPDLGSQDLLLEVINHFLKWSILCDYGLECLGMTFLL